MGKGLPQRGLQAPPCCHHSWQPHDTLVTPRATLSRPLWLSTPVQKALLLSTNIASLPRLPSAGHATWGSQSHQPAGQPGSGRSGH